jgi:hypothetical protein
MIYVSRPDLREPFISLFWLGQGVTRVGSLVFYFLCWPGRVPNQRHLQFIVVSDWGSYLGSLFPTCCLWDLDFVLLLFSPTKL